MERCDSLFWHATRPCRHPFISPWSHCLPAANDHAVSLMSSVAADVDAALAPPAAPASEEADSVLTPGAALGCCCARRMQLVKLPRHSAPQVLSVDVMHLPY